MASLLASSSLLCILLLLFVVVFVSAEKFYSKESGVSNLSAEHFPDANAKNVWMVEFYAPWCGHCKSLKPAWETVAKKLNGTGIKVGAIDCDNQKNQPICGQYGIQGFPTIKMIKKGKAIDYNGGRDAASIESWAKSNAGVSSSSSSSSSSKSTKCTGEYGKGGVANLCAAHFPDKNAKHAWFVKFYAPWCGHCKALTPKWKELPGALKVHAADVDVKVGAIDCTAQENQQICQKFGVRGYPTLKMIKKGGKVEDYQGPRETQQMAQWAGQMARN